MSSNPINLHFWDKPPVQLFTVELKQYNIQKGFTEYLQGKRVILELGDSSEYMGKLITFLNEKTKHYKADVFEVSSIPNMGTGVWMDDITGDTSSCEVVQVKFYTLKPKEVSVGTNLPTIAVYSGSATSRFHQPLNVIPVDFEDACEALRKAGFDYDEDTDRWCKLPDGDSKPCFVCGTTGLDLQLYGHPKHGGVDVCGECTKNLEIDRSIRKHANFPFLYGRPASEVDFLIRSTSDSLANLKTIADTLQQQFTDMYQQPPDIFNGSALDTKGEDDVTSS